MQMRGADQVGVADARQVGGHVTDIERGAVNVAAGEIVIQIRIRKPRGEHQVLVEPGFRVTVDVEQVITRGLPVRELLFGRGARKLIGLQRIVYPARLITQPDAGLGRFDLVGHVQLKAVAVLIDVVEGRAEAAGHTRRRLRIAPTGRALASLPEGMLVFECDLRHVIQRQAGLE